MNILMLSATFPYPPTRGGTSVRTFNLLKFLKQQGHHIALGTLRTSDVSEEDVSALQEWVDELGVFQRPSDAAQKKDAVSKLLRLVRFAVSGVPPSVSTSRSPDLQAWVNEKIASGQFDAITCEHSVNEAYVPKNIQDLISKSIVNIHSSVYGTCAHQLANGTAEKALRDRLTLPLLKRYEQRYCQKFSNLVVTTTEDRRQMSELSGKEHIHVVSNGVDLDMFEMRSQDPNGQSLVFIGAMDNLPNIDAVTFLAREIFPLVRQKYPAATLSLVGARPTAAVRSLSEIPNVTVTGKVPEMTPYLHESTVCVVPMRSGYGIKNKTLEAMAAGIPVVASDRGLEGLPIADKQTSAIKADSPEDYAEAINRLFDSAELRAELSKNGRSLIEQGFTWAIAGKQYEQVLTSDWS